MEIIDLTLIAQQAWKNGIGLTRLIASGKQGGLHHLQHLGHIDEPHWRISLADLQSDGPFSIYPGIDRHAVLLSETPVTLIGNNETIYAAPLAVIHYAGEIPLTAHCGTFNTPPQFVNLMIKRGTVASTIDVITTATNLTQAKYCFVMPITGQWRVNTGKDTSVIGKGQALLCAIESSGAEMTSVIPGEKAIVITIN